MRVLVTSNSFGKFDDAPLKRMRDRGWEVVGNRYGRIMSEEEMEGEVPGIDAIIAGSDPISSAVLSHADSLKIISRYGVGIDNIDVDVCQERGIVVKNCPGCNTEAVADYAVGLMLDVLRHICNVDASLKRNVWKKETGLDLCHKTVGVIGLGGIGRNVIQRLQGFGCTFLGFDPYADEAWCAEHGVELVNTDDIFKQSDVITLHAPGNSDGSPLIGFRELGLMKDSAVLINTARASLVDEDALVDALKAHQIYGYGTDVFAQEPQANPAFIGLDNVVLSPHMAAVTVEAINKMTHQAVDNLFDYFEGKDE